MTWNLWNKNPSPEAVRDIILSQQPDIVALQELVDTMASPLRDELRATYPYQEIGRSAALGIFSRYPLQAVHNSTTEVKACRCPEVVVSWQEQQVRFINVHLPTPTLRISRSGPFPAITAFNSSKQGRWLDGLMQRMSGIGPLLVSGDFNIGDRQLNYDRLRTQLSDAFLEAGWGFGLSYPVNRLTRFPVVRIDYILHSKDWKATQAAVSEGLGV
jgi:endonuclease/exonuclease/phosphatase (EEP) superfamily protein YafD